MGSDRALSFRDDVEDLVSPASRLKLDSPPLDTPSLRPANFGVYTYEH